MQSEITVFVNGEEHSVPSGRRLAELVAGHTRTAAGVAVAVDGEVVPRAAWPERELTEGAAVEILTAVQGG